MSRWILRVTPLKGQGWKVTGVGSAPLKFDTKSSAVSFARRRCREQKEAGGLAQLVVHKMDGKIHYENTYGKDPKKYKG